MRVLGQLLNEERFQAFGKRFQGAQVTARLFERKAP